MLNIFKKLVPFYLVYSRIELKVPALHIITFLVVRAQFPLLKPLAYGAYITGLLLAFDVYRSKFSATSSYITGTFRNNEQFLWVCAGIWAVREFL